MLAVVLRCYCGMYSLRVLSALKCYPAAAWQLTQFEVVDKSGEGRLLHSITVQSEDERSARWGLKSGITRLLLFSMHGVNHALRHHKGSLVVIVMNLQTGWKRASYQLGKPSAN